MKKHLLLIILFLCIPRDSFAAPSNTMSITPAAVDAQVIEAADENTRNSEISSKFNAHDHTDISTLANTVSLGDGTASNKTIQANNADASKPFFRFDDSNNKWIVSLDGSNTSGIVTVSGGDTDSWTSVTAAGESGQAMVMSGTQLVFSGMNNAGDIDYLNSSGFRQSLAIGATDNVLTVSGGVPTWSARSSSSTGQFSVDTTALDGTQPVNDVGFQPTACIFHATEDGTDEVSFGVDDGTTQKATALRETGVWVNNVSFSINDVEDQASDITYRGKISSFDSNGFTISWTKQNSPTGTLLINYFCSR